MFFTRVIAQVKRTCNVCRWCTLVLLLQSATTPPLDSRFMTSLIPTPVCHVTLLFITSTNEEMFVSRFVGWLVCPLAGSPDYHGSDRPSPPTAAVPSSHQTCNPTHVRSSCLSLFSLRNTRICIDCFDLLRRTVSFFVKMFSSPKFSFYTVSQESSHLSHIPEIWIFNFPR